MSDQPREDLLPDELAALADLPPEDPRIAALGPRSRALLHAYRAFLSPAESPAGARVREAEVRLGEVLERELGVTLDGEATAAGGAARGPVRGGPPMRGSFLDLILGPRLRPALALAVVVIVAGAVWLSTANRRAGEDPVMRGGEATESPDELRATVRTADTGTVRLDWTPSPTADGYALVFLSADLAEIARVRVREPGFDLSAAALPPGLASGSTVLWRVIALHGTDEIARSRTATLIVP